MSRAEYTKATLNLLKWSGRDPWQGRLSAVVTVHLGPIEDEYKIDADDIDDLLEEHRMQMLRTYILEDFCSVEFGEEEKQNVVDAYLEKRGWRESVLGKRYLEALRQSVTSLYEIVAVNPDGAMTIQDRLRDEDPVVLGKGRALEDLGPGDYVAGRVAMINGDPWLANGHLPISPGIVTDILDACDEMLKDPSKSRKDPARSGEEAEMAEEAGALFPFSPAAVISWVWMWRALDEDLSAEDVDEEDITYFEVHFPLKTEPEEVASILDTVEGFDRDEEGLYWAWIGPYAPDRGGFRKWVNRLLGKDTTVNDEFLGMVEIEESEVVLDTGTEEIAKRGRDLLISCLGDRVGSPRLTLLGPVYNPEESQGSLSAGSVSAPPLTDRARHARLTGHYLKALDEPVSLLGGKTPREAAQTEEGRRKVSNWLEITEEFESRYATVHGFKPFDLSWMWEELGVDGARRH